MDQIEVVGLLEEDTFVNLPRIRKGGDLMKQFNSKWRQELEKGRKEEPVEILKSSQSDF